MTGIGWMAEACALFCKDVRAELRSRVAVNSVGLFAFSSLLLLALATRGLSDTNAVNLLHLPLSGITLADVTSALSPAWTEAAKMGLLWALLCFAAFAGLAHSFVHEEEGGTVAALRLSMSPEGVYAGKLAFNLALLAAIAAIVTPLYMVITRMQAGNALEFALLMFAGCLGLGATSTITAALAAKAQGSAALFGAIGLPIVTVFLILLINASNTLYNHDATTLSAVKDVGGLMSFGVLVVAASAFTFRYAWEE